MTEKEASPLPISILPETQTKMRKIAKHDRDKSFRMLNRAIAFTPQEDLGILQEITSRLRK